MKIAGANPNACGHVSKESSTTGQRDQGLQHAKEITAERHASKLIWPMTSLCQHTRISIIPWDQMVFDLR
jgi:hypothetical protein